jgi:hypothetical protein
MKYCIHCGKCCKAIPCAIGLTLLGDHRPCLALEKYDNKFLCGLVLHPQNYLKLGFLFRKWKKNFVIKLVKDYNMMGCGCDQSLLTLSIQNDIKKRFLKKKYTDSIPPNPNIKSNLNGKYERL